MERITKEYLERFATKEYVQTQIMDVRRDLALESAKLHGRMDRLDDSLHHEFGVKTDRIVTILDRMTRTIEADNHERRISTLESKQG